jgi:Fe-Mn family superoxide dismutase
VIIQLPPLPYALDALEPHVSAETLSFHHGMHHRGYVEALNELLRARADIVATDLPTLVRDSYDPVLRHASQALNHELYWLSLAPDGGGEPPAVVARALETSFGTVDAFRRLFTAVAREHFGSGWVWLVRYGDALVVEATHDAGCPLRRGRQPLLTCDLWEHAYYLDHRHRRDAYLRSFWNVVDWTTVAVRMFDPDLSLAD